MEPQRKTCAAKRLPRSHRVKGPTGTAEAFVLEVTSRLYSPRTREPYETRFQGGTEIRGFNQIEKFLQLITPQKKLYCFSETKILGLGAL